MTTLISTSTSAFYERSVQDMTSLRKQAEALQASLGSNQKLSRSSDDPVAASRLRVLTRADKLANIDETNANRATADLTLTDSALSSFATFITRARELATQAATGTLTPTQRSTIGVELDQIYGNLVTLANARDSAGHALFGGESAGDAYQLDASGNAVYIGTASSGELPISEGQTVQRGLTGPEFLNFDAGGGPTNLLAVVKDLATALQSGPDPQGSANASLTALGKGLEAVTTGQTLVGSRLSWIDLTTERRTNLGELRADEQEQIGAPDIGATIAQMQQLMVVLEASQAGFTKLAGLSLFNKIG
ncbi:MAG TPA: flagellar biosynthesis protein FlgL [Novosphingobium sp.]